jgi:hypothetical protein
VQVTVSFSPEAPHDGVGYAIGGGGKRETGGILHRFSKTHDSAWSRGE